MPEILSQSIGPRMDMARERANNTHRASDTLRVMGQQSKPLFVQPPSDLPVDALGHDDLARKLVDHAARLPAGSSIALQGPWGRGKTDVLWRVHTAAKGAEAVDGTKFVASVHINPWSYGEPDLLTPLVIKLLELIPPERRSGNEALKIAAQTVIKSGLNFGMKAVSYLAPAGGRLLEAAADPTSDLLTGLFEARDAQDDGNVPDLDPVAAMRKRFCELCSAVVESASGGKTGGRLLVVVDDLDRCLPSRQIALLEAVYFLANSSAGEAEVPPVSFIFAIDSQAISRVIQRQFSASIVESQLYIDKLFEFKSTLPEVAVDALEGLLNCRARNVLNNVVDRTLFLPGIRTPRLARRLSVVLEAVVPELNEATIRKDLGLEWQSSMEVVAQVYLLSLYCPGIRAKLQPEDRVQAMFTHLRKSADRFTDSGGETESMVRALRAYHIATDADTAIIVIYLFKKFHLGGLTDKRAQWASRMLERIGA